MNESVAPAEVSSILTDYGRQHPRADTDRIHELLADVFGDDFSNLEILKATNRDDAHVLEALGAAFVTIHPTYAVFHWGAPDYALPDPRGLHGGSPLVRWEPARYSSGIRTSNTMKATLCPNCFIEFPGSQCDLCGREVSQ